MCMAVGAGPAGAAAAGPMLGAVWIILPVESVKIAVLSWLEEFA